MSRINWRSTAKENKMFGIHFSVYLALMLLLLPVFRIGWIPLVILTYAAIITTFSMLGNRKGISVGVYMNLLRHKLGKALSIDGRRYLKGDRPLQPYRRIHRF